MISARMVAAFAEVVTEVTSGIRICLKGSSLDGVIICTAPLGRYVHVGIAHRQYLHGGKDASPRSIHTIIEVGTVVLSVSAMILGRGGRVFQRQHVRAADELLPGGVELR